MITAAVIVGVPSFDQREDTKTSKEGFRFTGIYIAARADYHILPHPLPFQHPKGDGSLYKYFARIHNSELLAEELGRQAWNFFKYRNGTGMKLASVVTQHFLGK